MAHARKEEIRALSSDELELVEKSHHPDVQELNNGELSELLKLLRERRDRAQTTANQQRREMRRKADPRGSRPSAGNTGTRIKGEVLAMAVRRVNAERERRRTLSAKADLVANAQKALANKKQADSVGDSIPENKTPNKGMRKNTGPRPETKVPGAKIGSVSQQNKNAQAKRDS